MPSIFHHVPPRHRPYSVIASHAHHTPLNSPCCVDVVGATSCRRMAHRRRKHAERAPHDLEPPAGRARAPPRSRAVGRASWRGMHGKGGGRCRVRGVDRREERERGEERRKRRERRERRANRWVPPPCGVHVCKTTTKTTQWPSTYGFKSWAAGDSWFYSSMVKIKLR